jgi:type II secretory pathway component PulF
MIPAYAPYDATSMQDFAVPSPAAGDDRASTDQAVRLPLSLASDRKNGVLPVSKTKVLLVLNQLAVMSQNGVELADALGNVAAHCQDKRLARSLDQIHESVSSGSTFSTAMAMYGEYFPSIVAPMLAAAEATGEVPETLGKACVRMRGELEMRGAIASALIYPAILISASLVVMTSLVLGVLPQFSKVFVSMGRPVPPATQMLLSLGDFCRQYWVFVIPAIIGLVVSLIVLRKHRMIRGPVNRLLMYGPFIRNAYRPMIAGRNLRTMAAMVRGGVPLLQAVRLTRNTTADLFWRGLLKSIEGDLIDGLAASNAMTHADFLPPETAQMMATGERTGRVGEVLEDVGTFYEQEGARKIKRLVIGFEPVIILCMGVVVAGIVLSVMLPLLDVSTIR